MAPASSRPRRVAIAVRMWAAEESIAVWNWASKYFIRTGAERDWLYIVHVNKGESKSRDAWKAAGPVIADVDRALQPYSYDIVVLHSDNAATALVQFVRDEAVDVLVVSMGRSKGPMGRLNFVQSRTTDYIASHSPCATLVIHPQITGADLTRCHIAQASDAAPAMDKRRVAMVAETDEALASLAEWAAASCSRPDDIEFRLVVNKQSMLARVTTSMRPGSRRKSGVSTGANDIVSPLRPEVPPTAAVPTPLPAAMAALEGGSTVTVTGGGEGGAAHELQGKLAQVIKGFVADNKIDLLVVPVPPPSTLKRLDPRNMRDQRREASKSVYQKAQCTCLCVPSHLLSGAASAAAGAANEGGMMFSSEDEGDDDEWRAGARSPRRGAATPTSPRSTLTTQAIDPTPRASSRSPVAQLQPAVAQWPAAPRHASPPSLPVPDGIHVRTSREAPRSLPIPAAQATVLPPQATLSPTVHRAAAMDNAPGHRAQAIAPPAVTQSDRGTEHSAEMVAPAHASAGSGEEKGLLQSIRSKIAGRRRRGRARGADSHGGGDESKAVSPREDDDAQGGVELTGEVEDVSARLAELHAVLVEGGLSGDMRTRGAEAVTQAQSLFVALSCHAAELQDRAEAAEARLQAVRSALDSGRSGGAVASGTSPADSTARGLTHNDSGSSTVAVQQQRIDEL